LSGRLSYSRPAIFQAPIFADAGGPAQGAFEGNGLQRTYSSGLNYDRIISPTLIAEVRFGVAYYHNDAQQSDYGKDDATAVGVPGVNISQFTSGMVGISIGGFSSPLKAELDRTAAAATFSRQLPNRSSWQTRKYLICASGPLWVRQVCFLSTGWSSSRKSIARARIRTSEESCLGQSEV
jgi:hypothetical protein